MQQTQRHHYRPLLEIGVPIVIGQLGTIILGFADTLMIGHHSTIELGAAGLVNNIFTLGLLFYLGFSYGLTPIVGRLFGMGRTDEIGQKVRNSIVANMVVGLLLMAMMMLLYLNLHNIGQPEELLPIIRPYFLVNLVSIPFVGMFNTLKQFFDGITRTQVPMWVMIGGNVVNILFNWLLIYGVGPFPELGLLGAGISTMGSRVVMSIALVVIFFTGRGYVRYRQSLKQSTVTRADFVEMNRLGWPVALQLGTESAAFTLSCVMVGWLGTIPLASHQIMITISQLFYLVLSGMASAISIRISYFMGQKEYDAMRCCAADGFRMLLVFSAVVSLPIILFRHDIGFIFTDNDEACLTVAHLIWILVIYQFGDGMQYIYANALRGIACVKPMMYYAFIAYFCINLPVGYVLGFVAGWGIYGIWTAFPIGLTIAGILFYRRFIKELRVMAGR